MFLRHISILILFFDELSTRNLGGVFAGDVTHPGRNLDHIGVVGRSVLLDEHSGRIAFGIEYERNNANCTGRTHDVAGERRAVWCNELSDGNVPDVALVNQGLADPLEFRHCSGQRPFGRRRHGARLIR